MRLALLAPAFAAPRALGDPAPVEPCRIGSIAWDFGGKLPERTLARDSTYCRQLEEIWPDFVALVRAAGPDPKRHGLFFIADDNGPPNAKFMKFTGDVGVNAAMLSLPGGDRNMLRGILAHELGHAVQLARGVRIFGRQKAAEGQADAIGAELMEIAGFGGAAAMREMWKDPCDHRRAGQRASGSGHPMGQPTRPGECPRSAQARLPGDAARPRGRHRWRGQVRALRRRGTAHPTHRRAR